ncbi:MAG: HD domain-containing protein [Patescibacteria group bacterium]|nr:HD domain-containing protein [Patescibacteria group bacterium]
MEEAQKLLVMYAMKHLFRYSGARDPSVHGESIAEHTFADLLLAEYFLPLEDPERRLDWNRVRSILLYHDVPEIPDGDTPYHLKTLAHEAREREAAQEVFAQLPASLGERGYEHWHDYEMRRSPEAHFAYAVDKLEPVFELFSNETSASSMWRLHFTYEQHMGRKRNAIHERYPIMWRFVEVLSEDMRRRGVFWEPPIIDGA